MSTCSNFEDIEKAFYSDGYQLGMKAVEKGMSSKVIQLCIRDMFTAINNLIESLSVFAKKQGYRIACKKGCEWCCHQPIFALDYELDYLSSFIDKYLSIEEQKEINPGLTLTIAKF